MFYALAIRFFDHLELYLEWYISKKFYFLEDDAEIRSQFWAVLSLNWSILWTGCKSGYIFCGCMPLDNFLCGCMPLEIWLYASTLFLVLMSSLWSIIMYVLTSQKVGTFTVYGLLDYLLNVNKDIYNFFPWKKIFTF